MWWELARGREQLEEFVERRARTSTGRYQATSVKLMMDGVLENFTGAMLEPYGDGKGGTTDNRGLLQIDPEGLTSWVPELDSLGFQPHFHAIGDRAVRASLDAVEASRRANGPSDTRPHIAHIQVIHPDDVPRFATLDVTANAQPYWACHEAQMDTLTIPFLGPERATWQYPFRALLDAGARLAMGSDWSVSTPNPLLEIEVAVTRVADESRGLRAPFLPEQALTLEESIRGFTMGSAFVNHLDEDTGSITVGKLADLAVVDRDLFAGDAGPIGDGRVVATVVGGELVFEAAGLG
jgi:predicted amidohydrolase YtcJ